MLENFKTMNLNELKKIDDSQYQELEKSVADRCLNFNALYSLFAIALHITFCIEVYQYQPTDSEICSIVASGLFMLCHIYKGKQNIHCFSCCCILPIQIAGFALSHLELLDVITFLFQLALWEGEAQIYQIFRAYSKLKMIRELRNPQSNNKLPTNVERQIDAAVDKVDQMMADL